MLALRTVLGIAAGGCLLWAAWSWLRPAPPAPPAVDPARLLELAGRANSIPPQRPAWLRERVEELQLPARSQLLLLQPVPDQRPLVLATSGDAEGEPGPPWPCPWPAVNAAAAEPLPGPRHVSATFHGRTYSHWLVPLDSQNGPWLLVNTWQPAAARGRSLLWLLLGAAAMLLAVLAPATGSSR